MYGFIITVPLHSTEHVVMKQYITNITKRRIFSARPTMLSAVLWI